MGKLKSNLKKHVWHKYAISAAVLGGIVAISLGSIAAATKKSVAKTGRENPTSADKFMNVFIDLDAAPVSNFIEVHNGNNKVVYDTENDVVNVDGKDIKVAEYFDEYYNKYHALPHLNIKYGSFDFFNKYIEAVNPNEFYKFTKWFMKNVSWGPEIITLKSFSIVKGVEMKGNSITLGQHVNKDKESTNITFFPDAFFGTLPIYSELGGRGNAQDSLTYKVNKKALTETELIEFLQKTARYNSLANISKTTIEQTFFRNIFNVTYLKGQKVFAIKREGWQNNFVTWALNQVETERFNIKSPYLLVIAAENETEARSILKSKIEEYKQADENKKLNTLTDIDPETIEFEEKVITKASIKQKEVENVLVGANVVDEYLELVFDDGTQYFVHQSFDKALVKNINTGEKFAFGNFIQIDTAIAEAKNNLGSFNEEFVKALKRYVDDIELIKEEKIFEFAPELAELESLYKELFLIDAELAILKKNYEGMEEAAKKKPGLEEEVKDKEEKLAELEKQKKELEDELAKTTDPDRKKEIDRLLNGFLGLNTKIEIAQKALKRSKKELTKTNEILDKGGETLLEQLTTLFKGREEIKDLEESIQNFEKFKTKFSSDEKASHYFDSKINSLNKRIEYIKQTDQELQILKDSTNIGLTTEELIDKKRKRVLAIRTFDFKTKKLKAGRIFEIQTEVINRFGIEENKALEFVDSLMSYKNYLSINNVIASSAFDSLEKIEKAEILRDADEIFYNCEVLLKQGTPIKPFAHKKYYEFDIAYLPNELISVETLAKAEEKTQLNWRDYYNITQFVEDKKKRIGEGYQFYVYAPDIKDINGQNISELPSNELVDGNKLLVKKSRIEIVDVLTKKGILKPEATKEEIDKVICKMTVDHFAKEGSKLVFTLINKEKSTSTATKYLKFSVDANAKKDVINSIDEFFSVLGYKKLVSPTLIKEQNEVTNLETGELEKTFDVFADAYENLTDTLLREVPYGAEWLQGLHIAKKINDDGVIEYKLENGKYLGFNKDTRVGLWAILKMSDPNFKGISTDFLKFVGAHEYGHHLTLNTAQDLSNRKNSPVFVSALMPNATPNINNYYSKDILDLYLKARTHLGLETRRLLDEFGVVKDYGEYPVFKFATVDDEGNVVFNEKSPEKEEDIWGVDLNNPNLKAALSNKKRRFLQDFAGLLKAVEERRKANGLTGGSEKWLEPFDLWIANALDYYSGTLNPTVFSNFNKETDVKYMVKDPLTGEYKFVKASLEVLKGILKDGVGNVVEFEEIDVNGKIELVPLVVKGEKNWKGQYIQIDEVLIKNKDGSPVVNVPLGVKLNDPTLEDFDPYAMEYVNNKINVIQQTIQSLIVTRYGMNGWDSADSKLDATPRIDINYSALRATLGDLIPETINKMFFNIYKDYIKVRDIENGTHVDDDDLMWLKYYEKDGSGDDTLGRMMGRNSSIIYASPKAKFKSVTTENIIKTLIKSGNEIGAKNQFNIGDGQILFLDKDHMYMPNANLGLAYEPLFFTSNLPQEYIPLFGLKNTMRWLAKYSPHFLNDNKGKRTWMFKNKDGEVITIDHISMLLNNVEIIDKIVLGDDVSLIDSDKDPIKGLFGCVAATEFDNYYDWLDFITVDFRKAKYSEGTKTVNWDIAYVKSKINIEEFKKAYKTEVLDKIDTFSFMIDEQKDAINVFYKKANADTTNQLWANEAMKRFSSLKYAMFNSCLRMDELKNNQDYIWIFDSNFGYGGFKKNKFVFINPNETNWEISKEELITAYEEIAKKMNAELGQFTLFDSLVFDNKIQIYTGQLLGNLVQQKGDLLSVFTSLGNATFTASPSQDVLDYFVSKNDRKFNEIFSDYTYNFAELINRDNLQITYTPPVSEFGNMPAFLSGINEANTGLEYIVDGTASSKWLEKAIKFNTTNKGILGMKNLIIDYENLIDAEKRNKAAALGLNYKKGFFADANNLNEGTNYQNSYFGDFQSINNGWFKDRWYRDFLGFKLYDDNGEQIYDDTIRIKDLCDRKVTRRAEAFWQFYIQSQGVGRRNITTIWRDKDKDAVAMFGYLSSDIADKVNYIAFKDCETGVIKTIKLSKQHTNNMFYYKKQHIMNEKWYEEAKSDEERDAIRHTLANEEYKYTDLNGEHEGKGFVSWVSDYAVMSSYKGATLLPGHTYEVYFSSDEEGQKDILKVDLGDWDSLAENGKTFSQAPVRIAKEADGKHIVYVYDQFNGVK